VIPAVGEAGAIGRGAWASSPARPWQPRRSAPWGDDELPPPPVVEVDGVIYIEAGLVRDVVDDIWSQSALAFRRSVEVAHHQWINSREGRELHPDGCPGHCLIHEQLTAVSQRRAAA